MLTPRLMLKAAWGQLIYTQIGASPAKLEKLRESVLQLTSGQVAILGGLMQDTTKRNRDQVPYVGNLPRAGDLFAYRDEDAIKSELVIFIRPVVVVKPSLDSDELKHLRKLLPEIDQTGQTP